MAKSTGIIWARSTFNAWTGCTKVGPGCDHCYAETMMDKRLHVVQWGPSQPRKRSSPANWKHPLKWNREAPDSEFAGRKGFWPVFVNSASDVFDNEVDPQWRADLFALIRATPNLTWLLLTKRIGNAAGMMEGHLTEVHSNGHGTQYQPWRNVWIGATVVNQEEADRDIPKLLAVPAAKRFLSIEPMLGPIDLMPINKDREINEFDVLKPSQWEQQITAWTDTSDSWEEDFEDFFGLKPAEVSGDMHPKIDWVIAGGESGPKARPAHPDWFRSLREQCADAGVPFLFKQWGEWAAAISKPDGQGRYTFSLEGLGDFPNNPQWHHYPDGQAMARIGTKAAGNHLDGRQHIEFP